MPRKPSPSVQVTPLTGSAAIDHAETTPSEAALALRHLAQHLRELTAQVDILAHQLQDTQHRPTDLCTLRAPRGARLLTVDDLAPFLNVERRVIDGMVRNGLPALRVGTPLRFDPLPVKAWLEQQQRV
jgi:excisionase family DNA binding protein